MSQLLISFFGGYSFWDYITVFFDYIPKIMYFLYAALASILDAIQCLMRKLIGLDTYYMQSGSGVITVNPSMQSDPVLNFIYGILGIGDNAAAYSPLSTVFWSMAIFGCIVLVIATMVAIIKSHYNEDSAKTSPVGYVYTALKSIFTFGITPIVVILGFWLSSFLLQTLDNITAGAATAEKVVGIYGPEGANKLVGMNATADENGNTASVEGKKSYSRYDFFGFGSYATSETISGMLFKTCAYDANRVRAGKFDKDGFGSFGGLFGTYISNVGEVTQETQQGSDQWRASTAYQIDYAFANNLNVSYAVYTPQLYVEAGNVLITITNIDIFALAGVSDGFSKYNVGLVWYYYNLWEFNFLVGFLGAVTLVGLLFNIIMGVMTRLIKSAALFLIYPAVLGLAPLDEFGAFKKWRGEFSQQMLMAFGSIIGMNIFFLILPYVNEFKWFGFVLLDYMVTVLFMVVGLQMVKQLIAFMSSLIGGADAQAAGAGVADGVKSGLKKGAGMALGAANVALKAAKFIPGAGSAVGLAGSAITGAIKNKMVSSKTAKLGADAAADEAEATRLEDQVDENVAAQSLVNAQRNQKDALTQYTANHSAEFQAFRKKGQALGMSGEELDKYTQEQMHQHAMKHSKDYKDVYEANQHIIDQQGYSDTDMANLNEAARLRQGAAEKTERQSAIAASNYMEIDKTTGQAKKLPHALRQKAANSGKELLGAMQKAFIDNLPKDLGINMGALVGVFTNLSNGKFDDKGNRTGSYNEGILQTRAGMNQSQLDERAKERSNHLKQAGGAVGEVFRGILSPNAPKPPEKPKQKAEEASLEASKGMKDASSALLEISQKLGDSILKLDKVAEKMERGSTKK